MSELKDQRPTVPAVPPGAPEKTPTPPLPLGGLGALAIGGLTIGPALLLGFVEGVFDSLRAALKIVKLDFISTRLMEKFKNSKVFAFLDNLVLKTYVMFDDFLVKPLTNFGTFVGDKFRVLKNFFDPTGVLGKIFRPITDGAEAIGGVFSRIGATFGKFFGAFRAFGAVVGRLFVPIGIIMSVVDTIKGTIAGFTEEEGSMIDKLIAGLFGGLKGLINGLIMMPLDLLKDGVSWIAGKLGFENFSEILDSFSFQDLFSNMVDKVKEIVQKIFRFPVAVTKAGKAALGAAFTPGESATETFGKVFSEVMAGGDTAESGTVTASATSASAASVNEPPPEEVSRPAGRGAVARRQRMEAQAAEEAGQAPTVTVINNTNAPTTTTNNNTSAGGGAPLPQPTQSNGSRADAYAGA